MDPTTIYTGYLSKYYASEVESKSLADTIELIRSESLSSQIEAIRAADQDKRNELKRSLHLFFPTLFWTGKNELTEHSQATGMVQFDVDYKDNPDCDFAKLRDEVIALPETIYAFASPSGGLKFGLLTDFRRAKNESKEASIDRYKQAYGLVSGYVQESIATSFTADKSVGTLKHGCYLSSDPGAYLNQDCRIFAVNDKCHYSPPKPVPELHNPVDQSQVAKLLSYVPSNLDYPERLPIIAAVLSELGAAGIPLLRNHWTTSNRTKLENDIQQLLKRMQRGGFDNNLGTLINAAKEGGWQRVTGRKRQKLTPMPIDSTFEPLLTSEEAESRLKTLIQQFFDDRQSRFINFSTGAGKTYTVLKVLEEIDPFQKILFLVKTHELAEQITQSFNEIRSGRNQQRDFKAIASTKSRIVHLKGRNALCENSRVRDAYRVDSKSGAVAIPAEQCTEDCELKAVCRYTLQFDNPHANIRVMMFNEYFNEPTRWFNGVDGAGNPAKTKWKPDFIIIDENILDKEDDRIESRSSRFPVIGKILDAVKAGEGLEEAILNNRVQILLDAIDNQKPRPVEFEYAAQYVRDLQKKNQAQKAYSLLLNQLLEFVITEEASYLWGLRVEEDKLVQSVFKPVQSRYQNIPTLYLDATANRLIVDRLLPDVQYHPLNVKAKADINVYQLSNKTLTQSNLKEPEFLSRVIDGLKKLCSKYRNPGIITYKNIPGIKDFDAHVANKLGIKLYEHFGNLRGVNKFSEVDCLIILGRYCLNPAALKSYTYAVFNQKSETERAYLESSVRLKDGSAVALNSLIYSDPYTRAVNEHFSQSETLQAIGRGRLIHGKPKDIYYLSNEYLGSDIEIKAFLDIEELMPMSVIADNCWDQLHERGFVRNVQGELKTHLGLTKGELQNHRSQISDELIQAGFLRYQVKGKEKSRHKVEMEYFVKDQDKLELHLTDKGYKEITLTPISESALSE